MKESDFEPTAHALVGLTQHMGVYVAPPGSASTPHVHQELSEAFYVMEGELEFKHGDSWIVGGPGTFVPAPQGVQHAWRNVSSADARFLVVFSPGVPVGSSE